MIGALIVLLWKIRGAFPDRQAPGSRRLEIRAQINGMLI